MEHLSTSDELIEPSVSGPARTRRRNSRSGATLVEVMIAAIILILLGTGLTAAYVQNLRFSEIASRRTQATSIAMSIMEQIRGNGFNDVLEKYYTPESPPAFSVKVLDPSSTMTAPTGYRDFDVPINVRGTDQLSGTWTTFNAPTDSDPSAPTIPMRFWLTLDRDRATTGSVHELMRIGLIYQWRNPNAGANDWLSSDLSIVVPKLSVGPAAE